MALTESTCVSNASRPPAKTTSNLLDFVNNASSSIQDHLTPKKKNRTVNIRKYVQKRVKRLNDKPKVSAQTKSKSALKSAKPNAAQLLQSVGSRSWPQLATPNVQSQGYATTNYPTLCSPPSYQLYATSEASLYQAPPRNNKALIDPELDSLLSELECLDSQPSTRHSSDSYQTGTLESQVMIGEHPYSPPTSDYSDDPFDGDSAYSSPVGSVGYRSTACSPPMPAEWSVHSPPTVPVTTHCPVTSTVWVPEQPAVSGSGWLPQYASYTQGPPMTSTVSELLLDNNYF